MGVDGVLTTQRRRGVGTAGVGSPHLRRLTESKTVHGNRIDVPSDPFTSSKKSKVSVQDEGSLNPFPKSTPRRIFLLCTGEINRPV